MVAAAVAAGYGEPRRLALTFDNWQKLGLIDGMVRKTSRRGGEGRWHPVQQALLLLYLRERARRVRLPTLANAPIGFYLMGWEGVSVRQAQRAWTTWLTSQLDVPMGADSLIARSAVVMADRLAAPGASPSAKRSLQQVAEMVSTGMPGGDVLVTYELFAAALLDAMEAGEHPSNTQRGFVTAFYESLHLKSLAIAAREWLAEDAAVPLWEWAQRQAQAGMAEYREDVPRLQSLPDVGRFFESPNLSDFLNHAGSYATLVLGEGLDVLAGHPLPPGWEPPPSIGRDDQSRASRKVRAKR